MRVELLKHWKGYAPGKVLADMPDGAANVLIRRGFAREVSDTPTKLAKPKAKK